MTDDAVLVGGTVGAAVVDEVGDVDYAGLGARIVPGGGRGCGETKRTIIINVSSGRTAASSGEIINAVPAQGRVHGTSDGTTLTIDFGGAATATLTRGFHEAAAETPRARTPVEDGVRAARVAAFVSFVDFPPAPPFTFVNHGFLFIREPRIRCSLFSPLLAGEGGHEWCFLGLYLCTISAIDFGAPLARLYGHLFQTSSCCVRCVHHGLTPTPRPRHAPATPPPHLTAEEGSSENCGRSRTREEATKNRPCRVVVLPSSVV